MTLGDIIKKYRVENGMSMDIFAEKSGISKSYISLLEKNRHPKTGNAIAPSVAIIQQAAKAMNIDFDELFTQLTGCVSVDSSDPMPAYLDLEQALKKSKAVLRGDADGNVWLELSDGHTIELQACANVPQQDLQTIAAHFEGDDFTPEEMDEIKQFAEFVKSKRK